MFVFRLNAAVVVVLAAFVWYNDLKFRNDFFFLIFFTFVLLFYLLKHSLVLLIVLFYFCFRYPLRPLSWLVHKQNLWSFGKSGQLLRIFAREVWQWTWNFVHDYSCFNSIRFKIYWEWLYSWHFVNWLHYDSYNSSCFLISYKMLDVYGLPFN